MQPAHKVITLLFWRLGRRARPVCFAQVADDAHRGRAHREGQTWPAWHLWPWPMWGQLTGAGPDAAWQRCICTWPTALPHGLPGLLSCTFLPARSSDTELLPHTLGICRTLPCLQLAGSGGDHRAPRRPLKSCKRLEPLRVCKKLKSCSCPVCYPLGRSRQGCCRCPAARTADFLSREPGVCPLPADQLPFYGQALISS